MSEGITFGGWLKQRRRELGVIQEELAESIGCSGTAIRKIEVGERHPSGQIVQLLADYLSIPADEREAFTTFARTGRTAPISPETAPSETAMRAPWRNAYLHQTNLPALLTPMIGREQEAAAARSYLIQTRVRLLTLTGPPGMGKTRLALQVASDLVERFEDGVFLVELAALVDPDLVLPAIARALGLKEGANMAAESMLLEYVAERKMLLLLDNFEQVLDAAASIVKLMEASPWLKALVTSREALHVRGERRLSVPSLGLPNPSIFTAFARNQTRALATLASFASVQLFVERAQDVNPDFELTLANVRDVAMLCIGLEGVPLAIELAAARAKHLSPAEMGAALDNRLTLLTGGGRDLPARHRTLSGAIAWSYDLLDKDEQKLFRTLSAFVGGCTFAAIQAVYEAGDRDSGDEGASTPTLDILLALVDKSLVRQHGLGTGVIDSPGKEGPSEEAGETRFGMLEAIREYGLAKLIASGEAEAVRRRHARYFLALVREAQPQLNKTNQKWWMNRLNLENDNLRAALTWSLEAGTDTALEVGLAIGGELWDFWTRQGYVGEGKDWLERLLVRLDPRLSSDDRESGDKEDEEEIVQALTLHPLGSSAVQVLNGAGLLAIRARGMGNARRYLDLGLELARRTGNRKDEALLLNNLGNLSNHVGDYDAALRYFEDSLAIKRGTEGWDELNIASTLTVYSWALANIGRFTDALAVEEESLAIKRRLGDAEGVGRSLYSLAEITRKTGDYEASGRYGEQMLEIARNLGNREGEAHALRLLGDVARAQGRSNEAQAYLTDSLARFHDLEQQNGALDCIAHLAQVAADQGEAHRAGVLAGAHVALYTAVGAPQLAVDTGAESEFASVREQVGEAAWDSAWAEGQAMTMPQVIAYVLNDE